MMNGKERVLTVIARQVPDRVPMDIQANRWVLERLRRDWGTSTHRELLKRLRGDIVDIRGVVDPKYRGPVPQVRELANGVREQIWGWRQKVMETASKGDGNGVKR